MIVAALVAVFLATVLTGPAAEDWRADRRARRDRPDARVLYLPSSACRLQESDTVDCRGLICWCLGCANAATWRK